MELTSNHAVLTNPSLAHPMRSVLLAILLTIPHDKNAGAFFAIIFWMVILLLATSIYFLPSLIALLRRHHNSGAIVALNLFLGWTLVGWVVSLVWALTNRPHSVARI
jgi:hypothetical protein